MKKTNEEYSLLYDYYSVLLSERQREVFEQYNEDNLSLSEIAANLGVSRQAVHIAFRKACDEMEGFEEKLGLIGKHAAYEKAQAEIDDKKRKPSKEIRAEAMRDAIEFAQRTSGRGRGKAVLVYPAERMNQVAANALLKTLEEPPGDLRFVLATDAAHLLLPTIRSRCLTHTMTWPGEAEALPWLAAAGVPSDTAAALLRAAGGRPAEALALAAAKDGARQWAQLPRALAAGNVSALEGLPLPEAVARLQKLCHDLMAVQAGAAPRFFAAADLPQRPLAAGALARWWAQLTQAARTAEHPLNPGLATEALVSLARQALNSKS